MLQVIWEYRVKGGQREEFERYYGPGGDWAQFFTQDEKYAGTRLLRSVDDRLLYVTIDTWESRFDLERFKKKFGAEYKQRDAHCERFTSEERLVGYFEVFDM